MSNDELIKSLLTKYADTQGKVNRGKLPIVKINDGDFAVVRLLTFIHDGRERLYAEHTLHFVGNAPVVCTMADRDHCIVCDLVTKLKDAGHVGASGKLRATTRYFLNVAVVEKDGTTSLGVLSLGLTVFNSLLSLFADEEYRDLLLGETARNLKISRTGSGLDTKYSIIPAPKSTKVAVPSDVIDLYDQYQVMTDAEITDLVGQNVDLSVLDADVLKPTETTTPLQGDGFDPMVGEKPIAVTPDSGINPALAALLTKQQK